MATSREHLSTEIWSQVVEALLCDLTPIPSKDDRVTTQGHSAVQCLGLVSQYFFWLTRTHMWESIVLHPNTLPSIAIRAARPTPGPDRPSLGSYIKSIVLNLANDADAQVVELYAPLRLTQRLERFHLSLAPWLTRFGGYLEVLTCPGIGLAHPPLPYLLSTACSALVTLELVLCESASGPSMLPPQLEKLRLIAAPDHPHYHDALLSEHIEEFLTELDITRASKLHSVYLGVDLKDLDPTWIDGFDKQCAANQIEVFVKGNVRVSRADNHEGGLSMGENRDDITTWHSRRVVTDVGNLLSDRRHQKPSMCYSCCNTSGCIKNPSENKGGKATRLAMKTTLK